MIDRPAIEEILAQYKKHGWTLRRVLLSAGFVERVPDVAGIFEGAEIRPSELDGVWFSRSSRPGVTAWELRRLAETPYALVESISDHTDEAEAEAALKALETKMLEAGQGRKSGN